MDNENKTYTLEIEEGRDVIKVENLTMNGTYTAANVTTRDNTATVSFARNSFLRPFFVACKRSIIFFRYS